MLHTDKRRIVIVTGASRGLGSVIARCFGKAGERIVVNYRSNKEAARLVADEIIQNGGEAQICCADVRNPDEVNAMISRTVERWGAVDVLINNAAVTKDGIILRMNEAQWNEVIDIDLKGPFNCIRAVSQQMSKNCNGHIINISSIVGLQGREGQANYAAAKAGLVGLTKAAAKELGLFNIKVNVVLPGYLPSDMGSKISDAVRDRILEANTLGRGSDHGEVADFIRHISLMKNVSGQVFNLDSRIL